MSIPDTFMPQPYGPGWQDAPPAPAVADARGRLVAPRGVPVVASLGEFMKAVRAAVPYPQFERCHRAAPHDAALDMPDAAPALPAFLLKRHAEPARHE
jgi:hypothetical protein